MTRTPSDSLRFREGLVVGFLAGAALTAAAAAAIHVGGRVVWWDRWEELRAETDCIGETRPDGVSEADWDAIAGWPSTTIANTVFCPGYLENRNIAWLTEAIRKDRKDPSLTPRQRYDRFLEHARRIGPPAAEYVDNIRLWDPRVFGERQTDPPR